MAKVDPQVLRHKEWLGLLQPVGLVVAPVALVKGQAVPSKNVTEQQRTLIEVTGGSEVKPKLSFERFALEVLEWQPEDLVGAGDTEVPSDLDVALTEYREVLSPTFAVPDPAEDGKWLLLVKEVEDELDRATDASKQGWHTSPQVRFERLLRDNEVPIGVLANAENVRLVYAPTGESSGHLTFPVSAMREVAGRPILAALLMLLGSDRLFTLPDDRRLPTLLSESRKYQNVVSTELSQQVLRALGELLRGFQAADNAMNGDLLNDAMREDPQHVYGGLITVLMRLVFLLYAEERDLLPGDDVYQEHYSVTGLFEKLRSDAALYPDTMDQRYGAWARLLSLFRLIFDGGQHGTMSLPARQGQLFHPDEYPFLEGRPYRSVRQLDELLSPPRVSDGTVYRVLEDLLVLDGERLSYRTLDVEQIGSVYEAIMGFEVKRAMAPSIAVRPDHVVVNLQEILDAKPGQRAKFLKAEANCSVPKGASKELKAARTLEDLLGALGSRTSPQTPTVLPPGALFLQPTEERRRSGSHYTPRALTEPVVRRTLDPVVMEFGDSPTPEQILGLKVCDPAMGSGAFLVESCRYLADHLVAAWAAHGTTPEVPPDEDVFLHARRIVVQQCLYGVDKNPFAVNLAKLSLWLMTLARDHAFTFVDHALKHGDSLVGLSRRQIAAFHWDETEGNQDLPLFKWVAEQVGKARLARGEIRSLDDEHEAQKRIRWREAEEALDEARLSGDLVISAYFGESKDKLREARRALLQEKVLAWRRGEKNGNELRSIVAEMRSSDPPLAPLHWEVEFPEVFDREAGGFDAFVGNPPFLGGAKIWPLFGGEYRDWLRSTHQNTGGKAVDLVAHFFRLADRLIGSHGTVGMVATNTVAQGDTREAGLRHLCTSGAYIYAAEKRFRWPGQVSVVVSIVHLARGIPGLDCTLDGKTVPGINSFLFPRAREFSPQRLSANAGTSFRGCDVYGQGFVFDDSDSTGKSNSLSEMRSLIAKNPRNAERIFPFIGGKELGSSPTQSHHRYVINFADLSLEDAEKWPDLLEIVRRRVKPDRDKLGGYSVAEGRRQRWWQFGSYSPALYAAIEGLDRVMAISQVCAHLSFAFVPATTIFSHKATVFPFPENAAFCVLQSRLHETWARFLSSTAMDLLRYTSSDCMETFPLPPDWRIDPELDAAGKQYEEFRKNVTVERGEGLTQVYNRFHDPTEQSPDILKLRELHAAMDQATLAAYGWNDIKPNCDFLLDYEDEGDDSSSKRRKPWRYRWPDEIQEEVLSRLLDLNQERFEEERQAGDSRGGRKAVRRSANSRATPKNAPSKKQASRQAATAGADKAPKPKKTRKKRQSAPASDSQINMFTEDIE